MAAEGGLDDEFAAGRRRAAVSTPPPGARSTEVRPPAEAGALPRAGAVPTALALIGPAVLVWLPRGLDPDRAVVAAKKPRKPTLTLRTDR